MLHGQTLLCDRDCLQQVVTCFSIGELMYSCHDINRLPSCNQVVFTLNDGIS